MFLANYLFLKKFEFKELRLIIVILVIYRFFIWTINPLLIVFNYAGLNAIIDLNFLGSCYGLYLILGYYITDSRILEKVKIQYLILVLVLSSFIGITYQIFISIRQAPYNYVFWYDSLFILISSVCLFELINRLRIKSEKVKSISKNLSIYAYALFIVHIIVIEKLSNVILSLKISYPTKALLIFLGCFLISYVFTLITSRIKIIKKHLYLIKD